METYRVEVKISKDGALAIKDVPFAPGDTVEVVVRSRRRGKKLAERYPLRGKPVHYAEPFKSVAESDWEALR